MANKKISEFNQATAADLTDLLLIQRGSANYSLPISTLNASSQLVVQNIGVDEEVGVTTMNFIGGGVAVTGLGGGTVEIDVSAAGVSDWIDLSDTPADYVGFAGYATKVNGTEDGLEFFDFDPTVRALISIEAGSSQYLGYNNTTGEISIKALALTSVTVNGIATDIANFVSLYYTVGNEFQEGDTIVLNGVPSGQEVYMHNGGSAGDETDFTKIEQPQVVTYTGLTDTPSSFTGDANKFVRVNAGTSALEHVAASSINVGDFNDDGTYLTSFTETDPIFTASAAAGIVAGDITNWNTAYSHSQLTSGNPHSVTKADVGLGNVENTALSTWAGSTNLTTLGTITSGTWNGTIIGDAYITKTGDWTGTFDGQEGTYYLALANATGTLVETKGGTGQTTYATGDILYASAANTLNKLAIGGANQYLQIVGGVPTWQTLVEKNGIFDAANDGATVPTSFNVELTDWLRFGGNIGISQTEATPQARLHVEGGVSQVAFRVDSNLVNDALTVASDGDVTIARGIDTPTTIRIGSSVGAFYGTAENSVIIGSSIANSGTFSGDARNTFIGWNIANLASTTVQMYNVGMGTRIYDQGALTGTQNTSIGANLFRQLTTGTYNVGLGSNNFTGITTTSYNIAIGSSIGTSVTSATDNIRLGGRDDGNATTTDNVISIGYRNNIQASNTIAIGQRSYIQSANVATIGGTTAPIYNLYIGTGEQRTMSVGTTIQTTSNFETTVPTSNNSAQFFAISAGKGSGNGSTANGYIDFLTPDAIGVGAGLQPITSKMRLENNGDLVLYSTGATTLQRGLTSERPTGVNGMVRYNTTTNKFEGYENGAWADLISAGGVDGNGIYDGSGSLSGVTTISMGTTNDINFDGGASFSIGHASPATSTLVHIVGQATGNNIPFRVDTNTLNNALTVATDGDVTIARGIQTTQEVIIGQNNAYNHVIAREGLVVIGQGAQGHADVATGSTNTIAIGLNAAYRSTPIGNIAIGAFSLSSNSGALLALTGTGNVGVGGVTMQYANGNSQYNTAIGTFAIQGNSSGVVINNNTAVGYRALRLITTGSEGNTIIGANAMSNGGGSRNVAIGLGALLNANGANENIAIGGEINGGNGVGALGNLVSGTGNIAIGNYTALAFTSGFENIFIGYRTLAHAAVTASYNVGIGSRMIIEDGVNSSILLGRGAHAYGSNQMIIGGENNGQGKIYNIYVGQSTYDSNLLFSGTTIQTSGNWDGGTSNYGGKAFSIASGKGSGDGVNTGAYIDFLTPDPTTTGGGLQNLSSKMRLEGNGDLDVKVGNYKHLGVQGFTGTGSYTNFTISGGIITSAS